MCWDDYPQLLIVHMDPSRKSKAVFVYSWKITVLCRTVFRVHFLSGEAHKAWVYSAKTCLILALCSSPNSESKGHRHDSHIMKPCLCSKILRKNGTEKSRVLSILQTINPKSFQYQIQLSLPHLHSFLTSSSTLYPFLLKMPWPHLGAQAQVGELLLGCIHLLPNNLKGRPTSGV
jgi:hypothetical protein